MAKTPVLPTPADDDAFEQTDDGGNTADETDEFQVPDEADDSDENFRKQMASVSFDEARHEASRKKMQQPAGDYLKSEAWDFKPSKNVKVWDEDRQQGDINPRGRTVITLWGYPETRYDKEHNDYTPFLRFSFSPDSRLHRDPEKADKGTEDIATRIYTEAEEAFINVKERKPKGFLEVLDFLVEESYVLNTMNGDSGLFVLHVKAPRKKR
jgi:hypothetical protein